MKQQHEGRLASALRWASHELGVDMRIVQLRSLREDRGPWLLQVERAGKEFTTVLRVGGAHDRQGFATEAAALLLAEEYRVPAPRLIAADLVGAEEGIVTLLSTRISGTSVIPLVPTPERLHGFGALVGALHTIPLTPRADLPLRTRPIALDDFAAQRRATDAIPLFARAERHLAELPAPVGETVFVHGDLWQGNTLWSAATCKGLIDWDSAGAGQPGVDLGSIRFDAAMMFGPGAATTVLDGWRAAAGREPQALARWDIVAALSTPPDIGAWLPAIHGQGRADLDQATLQARRAAFLRDALGRSQRE